MSKFLFLDLDGVLITKRSCIPAGKGLMLAMPDECGARMLQGLCMKRDAHIVVSSTWRLREKDCRELLAKVGLEEFVFNNCPFEGHGHACWRTAHIGGTSRGHEIQTWLDAHPGMAGAEKYVIFDDDSDFTDEQKANNFVHTTFDDGISYANFERAMEILK